MTRHSIYRIQPSPSFSPSTVIVIAEPLNPECLEDRAMLAEGFECNSCLPPIISGLRRRHNLRMPRQMRNVELRNRESSGTHLSDAANDTPFGMDAGRRSR